MNTLIYLVYETFYPSDMSGPTKPKLIKVFSDRKKARAYCEQYHGSGHSYSTQVVALHDGESEELGA